MGNFVSKLKAIGLNVLKGLAIVSTELIDLQKFEPAVKLLLPQTAKVVNAEGKIDVLFKDVFNVIHQVEAMAASAGGLTGPQKLQLATNQITLLLTAGGITDPKLFADAS